MRDLNIAKKGFTLAEILITLLIVGSVATLTMPTLIQGYQKKSQAIAAQKVYTEMRQALGKFIVDSNVSNLSESKLRSDDNVGAFLSSYFKVVNNCGGTPTPCFATGYRSLSGTAITAGGKTPSVPLSCVTLASGASICMKSFAGNASTGSGFFYVDTNGPKGPNVGCRDYWRMYYFSDGSVDGWQLTPNCKKSSSCTSTQRASDWSLGCGDKTDPEDVDGISRLINNGWVIDY